MKPLRSALAALLLAAAAAAAGAVESDPLPVPADDAAARAVRLYNEGVALLVARDFAGAQGRFEAALAAQETLAEAHNNLAYALRMQGRHNFAASLAHYDRAIALKPQLAQAYMYRGVLFVQQGDAERARRDLERLRTLDARLAAQLQAVLDGAATGAERGGIAAQYE
ncbi:tetratricopeptide repeat protein [Ramlibacter sp.]|uniref:tetratricopeptide repeat protein n=1 Tax=Ramlibacter sp. TaxID=1917967 RepID=UPI002CC023A8|nr:tetratricopeptide repeat protein [Ramlibacter sp.]HWI80571.1 tetratricopeptide repeat protein [Ramlibacter sp.]